MSTRSLLTHAGACLVGIGIGLAAIALKPGGTAATAMPADSRNAPPTRRMRDDPSMASRQSREATRQILRDMPDKKSSTERRAWLDALPGDQIPALLEALCMNIGPEGLDYSDKSLIEKSIRKWLEESPADCIAWIEQVPPGAVKRHFLKELLEELLKTDPDQALALSEAYETEDPEWEHADTKDRHVKGRIATAWKRPDATAGEMLALFSEVSRGNGSGGSGLGSYPADFDFRAFLDGVAAWNKADKKDPSTMPTDLLEAWARRDPQAATEWFLQAAEGDGSVPFQDWDDIADAVTATSGATAYHQWTAELLSRASKKQFDRIARNIEERDMLDIANAIPDAALRDRTLRKMGQSLGSQEPSRTIALYAEISGTEARLDAIKNEKSYYFRKWLDEKSLTEADWRALGLSEQQVRQAVEK